MNKVSWIRHTRSKLLKPIFKWLDKKKHLSKTCNTLLFLPGFADNLSYMYPLKGNSVSSKYIRKGKWKGRPSRTPKLLIPKLIFKKRTLITVQINRKGLLQNSGQEFICNHWILSLKILSCFSQATKENKPPHQKKKKKRKKNCKRTGIIKQSVALANKAKTIFASFKRNRQEWQPIFFLSLPLPTSE